MKRFLKVLKDALFLTANHIFHLHTRLLLSKGHTYGVSKFIFYVDQLGNPDPARVEKQYGKIEDLAAARRFGTEDLEEYAYWSWRACGVANVLMILRTEQKSAQSLYDLVIELKNQSGYLDQDRWGNTDIGWKHEALRDALIRHGMQAQCIKYLSLEALISALKHEQYVIASVKNSSGDGGGHMVLVTGVDWDGNNSIFHVADPFALDGKGSKKKVSYADFKKSFTHKGIAAWN